MHYISIESLDLEALYHYLWKHRMFGRRIKSDSGTEVEILEPGVHNRDAGPDFSAAMIRIGDTEWAGNVEIHIKASDWERHGHHHDNAYDNVILHVVTVNDARAKRSDGTEILQACVTPPASFYNRYATLVDKDINGPSCLGLIPLVPHVNRADWISSLGIERIQEKAEYMKSLLEVSNGDWQQTIFIMLSRALGFGLNGVPFEMLAKSIPLNFVMRHKDNPFQIESIVFGQAGFLQSGLYEYDSYYTSLCREYSFLQKKYGLQPLEQHLWKYSRTRPNNFPHRRLAILSSLLAGGMQFYATMVEAEGDYDTLMECLDVAAAPYWHLHSRFGESESRSPLTVRLTAASREIILINVMAPFYFAYGSITGNPVIAEKGLNLLYEIKAEKNSITSLWATSGIKAVNSFESQALVQLTRKYCEHSRCLECRFGHCLLKQSMKAG